MRVQVFKFSYMEFFLFIIDESLTALKEFCFFENFNFSFFFLSRALWTYETIK